jgi:late competence protein required for DNA uptake (superfamily II DNA/RNA helicase)
MVSNSPHRYQFYRTKDILLLRFYDAFFLHNDSFLSTAYLRTLHTTFSILLTAATRTACLFF